MLKPGPARDKALFATWNWWKHLCTYIISACAIEYVGIYLICIFKMNILHVNTCYIYNTSMDPSSRPQAAPKCCPNLPTINASPSKSLTNTSLQIWIVNYMHIEINHQTLRCLSTCGMNLQDPIVDAVWPRSRRWDVYMRRDLCGVNFPKHASSCLLYQSVAQTYSARATILSDLNLAFTEAKMVDVLSLCRWFCLFPDLLKGWCPQIFCLHLPICHTFSPCIAGQNP